MYSLYRKQRLNTSLDNVWGFISSPLNLEEITPPDMKFEILTGYNAERMYPGQIIEYNITPLLGIKINWVTEITHVQDKQYFVDEQRFGPYAFWHHQHKLLEVPGGVEMHDIVHYKVPLGYIGKMAHAMFIRKKLEHIFEFRFKHLDAKFNGAAHR